MKRGGKGPKQAGDAYERSIAKALTDWWQRGRFIRVPRSGGWHTLVHGDLICVTGKPPTEQLDPLWPFSVECKRQRFNVEDVIRLSGGPMNWWGQCVQDAENWGKEPLLIFRRTGCNVSMTLTSFYFLGSWSRKREGFFLGSLDDFLCHETRAAVIRSGQMDAAVQQ